MSFEPVEYAVGYSIREERKRLRLTLKAVCERADISIPYLSDLECGVSTPSLGTLSRIARALGVTMNSLILEDGMKVDPDTEIPTAGRQTIGGLAKRIVLACGNLMLSAASSAETKVRTLLYKIYLAGYQMGQLDCSKRMSRCEDNAGD